MSQTGDGSSRRRGVYAGERVSVEVPATSANLGPAFDAVGLALNLVCRFEVEVQHGDRLDITAVGEGADVIRADEGNLVWQAVQACFRAAGVDPPGLRIRIKNEIPLGRGLGSSAAAIVGGVVAANRLLGRPMSTQELLELAADLEGHPDNVAPALLGGWVVVVAQDRGRLTWVRFDPPANMWVAVAVPSFSLPTSVARQVLPQKVEHRDAVFNVGRTALLVAALGSGNLPALTVAMEDRLHQPYRAPLVPGMTDALQAAREAGAVGAVLSGAGPSLLAIAPDRETAAKAAEAMCGVLRQNGTDAIPKVLRPVSTGALGSGCIGGGYSEDIYK